MQSDLAFEQPVILYLVEPKYAGIPDILLEGMNRPLKEAEYIPMYRHILFGNFENILEIAEKIFSNLEQIEKLIDEVDFFKKLSPNQVPRVLTFNDILQIDRTYFRYTENGWTFTEKHFKIFKPPFHSNDDSNEIPKEPSSSKMIENDEEEFKKSFSRTLKGNPHHLTSIKEIKSIQPSFECGKMKRIISDEQIKNNPRIIWKKSDCPICQDRKKSFEMYECEKCKQQTCDWCLDINEEYHDESPICFQCLINLYQN